MPEKGGTAFGPGDEDRCCDASRADRTDLG